MNLAEQFRTQQIQNYKVYQAIANKIMSRLDGYIFTTKDTEFEIDKLSENVIDILRENGFQIYERNRTNGESYFVIYWSCTSPSDSRAYKLAQKQHNHYLTNYERVVPIIDNIRRFIVTTKEQSYKPTEMLTASQILFLKKFGFTVDYETYHGTYVIDWSKPNVTSDEDFSDCPKHIYVPAYTAEHIYNSQIETHNKYQEDFEKIVEDIKKHIKCSKETSYNAGSSLSSGVINLLKENGFTVESEREDYETLHGSDYDIHYIIKW